MTSRCSKPCWRGLTRITGWHSSTSTCMFPSVSKCWGILTPIVQRQLGLHRLQWIQDRLFCQPRTRRHPIWFRLVSSTSFVFCAFIHERLLSDWIKLYLGKKNGTHVLGCEGSSPTSWKPITSPIFDQITNLPSWWRACRASDCVKLSNT